MRIAILGNFPSSPEKIPGGVEAVIKNLATAMAGLDGADVHVLTCIRGLKVSRQEKFGELRIHYLPGQTRFGNVTRGRADRRRLRAELQSLQPDIIHGHGTGQYALAALESGYPAIVTPHGMKSRENDLASGLRGAIRRRAERQIELSVLRRRRMLRT